MLCVLYFLNLEKASSDLLLNFEKQPCSLRSIWVRQNVIRYPVHAWDFWIIMFTASDCTLCKIRYVVSRPQQKAAEEPEEGQGGEGKGEEAVASAVQNQLRGAQDRAEQNQKTQHSMQAV